MTNATINKQFFQVTDEQTRDAVLSNIAMHYGITKDEAKAEIVHDDAEHLLDYLTGQVRMATSVLMRRHGLNAV